MRSDAGRLQDVLEAIERIERYAEKGEVASTKTSFFKLGFFITF